MLITSDFNPFRDEVAHTQFQPIKKMYLVLCNKNSIFKHLIHMLTSSEHLSSLK